MKRWYLNRQVLSWACYDWANAAFATTVMAGFFPTFFRQYWSAGADITTPTVRLGVANGLAGLIVAVLAPFLGVLADRTARRRQFLLAWSVLGAVATGALYWVGSGAWPAALVLFVLGIMGFNGAIVFHDALLLQVAAPGDYNRVSAFGYGLGYLGGGLLFSFNVLMVAHPAWFGLGSAGEAVRLSFIIVGVWWLLFSMPLALFVQEPAATAAADSRRRSLGRALGAAWLELIDTLRVVRSQRALWLFLVAYWLYIDGVNTVIKMAVDYGLALGLPATSLLKALLLTQFVAFPAAIVFGWLGTRWGARRGILLGLAVYAGVSLGAMKLSTVGEFFFLAVIVGLVQGGVQSLSRSLYGQFVPTGKSAQYFGFYNMLGKFAAVLGPWLIAGTAKLTGNPREAIGSVVILFAAGAVLLWRVRVPGEAA